MLIGMTMIAVMFWIHIKNEKQRKKSASGHGEVAGETTERKKLRAGARRFARPSGHPKCEKRTHGWKNLGQGHAEKGAGDAQTRSQ